MAFDAAPDAMALLDDSGRIVCGNRAAADLVALPLDAVAGRGVVEFVPFPATEFRELWAIFKGVGVAHGVGQSGWPTPCGASALPAVP